MSNFSAMVATYGKIDFMDMGNRQLTALREELRSVNPGDLVTTDDHIRYIELLKKFRNAVAENDKLHGENYAKTLSSLLSVGADGLYTNDMRFLFELIQNVDDCSYADPANCNLTIQFDTTLGRIILEYNETGFRPFDVFSITGIAEAAKNISPDKIEIGEKGIGFKSVFGVADKVLIQSGRFSFMLYRENFTVPEPYYEEGFSGVEGTKLTLYVRSAKGNAADDVSNSRNRGGIALNFYRKIVDAYCKSDALFSKNPILFLNKLTKIRFFIDSFRSLEFKVSRSIPNGNIENEALPAKTTSLFSRMKSLVSENKQAAIAEVSVEDDIEISAVLKDHYNGYDKDIEKDILCIRYTMPISYDRQMCVSRYGTTTAFNSKRMLLQVVVPDPDFISEVDTGALYSFLPTQVRTTVPMACHIPFKLDSSREHIDHQDYSLWFEHSCKEFSKLLDYVYKDLAKRVKEKITTYLPIYRGFFFDVNNGNDKVTCLKSEMFSGKKFCELPVFYTISENYHNCNDIFSFGDREKIADQRSVGQLLGGLSKELFIPLPKANPGAYSISIERSGLALLLEKALQDDGITDKALTILDENELSYADILPGLTIGSISLGVVSEIAKHTKCYNALNEIAQKSIKDNKAVSYSVTDIDAPKDIRFIISRDEPIDTSDLDPLTARFLKNRKYAYCVADFGRNKRYFIANNILILSSNDPLASFASFCHDLDKNDLFAANMFMRSASMKLNNAEDYLSEREYMELLRGVRNSIKTAFGKDQYNGYIRVIKQSGTDPNRFLHELLQNADDCKYPGSVIPTFTLNIKNNILTTEYNEEGFSKSNVRAITAIGESTKKKINSGNINEIGEKGIGFKSVFGVADDVSIFSGNFCFKLSADTPTVPEIITGAEVLPTGTRMVFNLRSTMRVANLTVTQLLELCLCLRKLKRLSINGIDIAIDDSKDIRRIDVNHKHYEFRKYEKTFVIDDEDAITERAADGKEIDKTQNIVFYYPVTQIPGFSYSVYCGLPTATEIGVPLCIDAPFELTSARDRVLQNKWNESIKKAMYEAYADLLEKLAVEHRIDVLRFIRFESLQYGTVIKFSLFKNDEWLNLYNVLSLVQTKHILPTYNKGIFATVHSRQARRYPKAVHGILSREKDIPRPESIIDNPRGDEFDSTLKNLGCAETELREIAEIISQKAGRYISEDQFRKDLYKYLSDEKGLKSFSAILQRAAIIPVKGKNTGSETEYVAWVSNDIYVDDSVTCSPKDYWLLDTKLLDKNVLESMLYVDVTVLDDRYKKSLYEDELKKIFENGRTLLEVYNMILCEYQNHRNQLMNSKGVLLMHKGTIPLYAEDGQLHTGTLFLSNEPEGYYCGKVIRKHIISARSIELAKFIGDYPGIWNVSYEELEISEMLAAEDVEDLKDSSIRYGFDILERCMFDGFISEDLINKYDLSGLKRADYSSEFSEDDFPNEPVKNLSNLKAKITGECRNAKKIIKEKEYRLVDKIVLPNGTKQLLADNGVRLRTISRYSPASNTDVCFCQMCRTVKSTEYIEVNNIQSMPEYYWPQMRISLCLECSKQFEALRRNHGWSEAFLDAIKHANIMGNEPIDIQIGNQSIRFTQTHLAEIQEILKSDKC